MSEEPHAVVQLLLKRMESHPEEFQSRSEPYYERWASQMEALREYGNETDNAAITAKLRDIRLAEVHEQVMDELFNGPERRRKQEEEREHERSLMMQQALAAKQKAYAQAAQQQAYQGQLGSYQNAAGAQGIVGKSATVTGLDKWSTIATATTEPTLSISTINAIKKALNL